MLERIDPVAYDPEQFLQDLQTTAHSILAPFDRDETQQCLQVFDEQFRNCVVQLKATDRPAGGVYYRFFYKGQQDLTECAQRHGLIRRSRRIQQEVLHAYRGATRAGLDFDSGYGLAKEWTFCGGPTPLEEILKLRCLPSALREHADFFRDFGLQNVFFFAEDFQHDTMNIYFGWQEECRDPDWIRRMVQATGGATPSGARIQSVLETQAMSGGIGMTFAWDRPELQRWCTYSLEVSAPVDLPERLQIFRDAPTLNREPQFNLAWSPAGMKLEKSYSRDATYFLTHEMGGDLRPRNQILVSGRSVDGRS